MHHTGLFVHRAHRKLERCFPIYSCWPSGRRSSAGKNVRGKAIFFNYFRCVNAFFRTPFPSGRMPCPAYRSSSSSTSSRITWTWTMRKTECALRPSIQSANAWRALSDWGTLGQVHNRGWSECYGSNFCHLILINEKRWYRWLMHLISGLFFGCTSIRGRTLGATTMFLGTPNDTLGHRSLNYHRFDESGLAESKRGGDLRAQSTLIFCALSSRSIDSGIVDFWWNKGIPIDGDGTWEHAAAIPAALGTISFGLFRLHGAAVGASNCARACNERVLFGSMPLSSRDRRWMDAINLIGLHFFLVRSFEVVLCWHGNGSDKKMSFECCFH